MQKSVRMEAFRLLKNMTFTKTINETVKRSIRVRLAAILEAEEKSLKYWNDNVKYKLNRTRSKQVEREFNKRIQALKIVIHSLTPFHERESDVPTFVIKKNKNG